MVGEHFARIAHRGQVVDLVPLGDQGEVIKQLVGLALAEVEPQRPGPGQQFGPQSRDDRSVERRRVHGE